MFEILGAWRTLLHISEWSGLSLGALAGCVALFIFVPVSRQAAILVGVAVVIAYSAVVYGDTKGRADVKAQWDAAEVQAENTRKERDAQVAQEIEEKFGAFAEDRKANQDEIDALKAVAAAGDSCPLGDAALQLRNGPVKADSIPLPRRKPAGDLRKAAPAGTAPTGGKK